MIAVALGAAVGLVLGLLGGGGSILALPALVYGLSQPVGVAVPTSLLGVGAAALVGMVPKALAHQVRWGVAMVFGGAGTATSFAGAWLNHQVGGDVVLLGFAALMAVVGTLTLAGRGGAEGRAPVEPTDGRWALIIAAGAGVGSSPACSA